MTMARRHPIGLLLVLGARSLSAHKVKSLVVGSLLGFGTFVMVVGTSLVTTVERTMSETITSSMRTYAAEGATIVTHQSNVPYFQKTLVAPATLSPDAQSKAAKAPMLQGVTGKDILTDGKQTIEIYATAGDTHTNEYTLIYLPGPRILVEADAYSPGPPNAPVPPMPPPNAVALYDEVQKLNYAQAHTFAAILLGLSFVLLLAVTLLQRRVR
jgi:hypothetical protein